ncbi:MAG: amidohydrolase family protein [Acidobacteria bacterium]|nr:amidohydrolase family protein [Acidobacteriota bacterium]
MTRTIDWPGGESLRVELGVSANVMTDTGCCGPSEAGLRDYASWIAPAKVRGIARVETLQSDLLNEDVTFEDLAGRFTARVRDALDGTANYGLRSYGMKSYLMPRMGLIKPCYDAKAAADSWAEYKRTRKAPMGDRAERSARGQVLLEYLLTLALEECLERDMPMQFHAGDGEAPGIILRNQRPYNLEEFVRFDKDGLMRMPKIIPIHAGYPLVGEATWLSHLYTNCYYEFSIMNPFVHQGLADRFREIMEAVPLSKMLYGSDAYYLPELNWLAGRWGKRFLSQALGVYVAQGVLTHDEAIEGARRILYQNNREVYNLKD